MENKKENKNKEKKSRSSRMASVVPTTATFSVNTTNISTSQTDVLSCPTPTPNYEGITKLGGSFYDNLANANFKNAKLTAISFVNVDLTNADFRGAKFNSCNFENANLTGADFRGAVLISVFFRNNTNLTGTNFSRATLTATANVFENNTIMKNTIFIDTNISWDSKIDANQTDVIRTNENLIDKLIPPYVSCQQKYQNQQLKNTFIDLIKNGNLTL